MRHQGRVRPPETKQVPGHLLRPVHDAAGPWVAGAEVDVAPGVRGEHREQPVEIAARGRRDEFLRDLPVLGGTDVEAGAALTVLDLLPGSPGKLAARRGRL